MKKKAGDREPKPDSHPNGSQSAFRACSQWISRGVGSPVAFSMAIAAVLVWVVTGPLFDYSDTWQLVINTATTIVTFLMVFLIQNTQNRDTRAIHLKLDELLRGVKGARTSMVDLESLTDEELDQLQRQFQELHERTASGRKTDQRIPEPDDTRQE